ncbi:MAG: CBS domain-containing protein [Deltaproteobacteria bacterium]|nr:MAG: CBS domain-containing protein [Deltaproteobacteria bacterium]
MRSCPMVRQTGTLARAKNGPQPATPATTHVSRIMSHDVITVRSGTSVDVVAEVMLSRGLSRVPVLDASDHLIGIVSKTDLVAQAHDEGDTLQETSEPSARDKQLHDLRGFHVHSEGAVVDDVMSQQVIAIDETATVQRAAQMMVGSRVHGLPVVTAGGRLVGFVSTMDVLAWLSGLR